MRLRKGSLAFTRLSRLLPKPSIHRNLHNFLGEVFLSSTVSKVKKRQILREITPALIGPSQYRSERSDLNITDIMEYTCNAVSKPSS